MQIRNASAVVLGFLLTGCTVGPPTEYHSRTYLEDDDVAFVETQGNRGWITAIFFGFPTATNSYFAQIDGQPTGMWETRVEVLPGTHNFVLSLQSGDGWGKSFGARCSIEFVAEAGEEYIIKVHPYEYYDDARIRGYYVWVENMNSGARVAGARPTRSDRPPNDLTCRAG